MRITNPSLGKKSFVIKYEEIRGARRIRIISVIVIFGKIGPAIIAFHQSPHLSSLKYFNSAGFVNAAKKLGSNIIAPARCDGIKSVLSPLIKAVIINKLTN